MKHLLLFLPFILSTPVFAQSASCFSIFAQKNQGPLTSESLGSLNYKRSLMPLASVLAGTAVLGIGVAGTMGVMPDILPTGVGGVGLSAGVILGLQITRVQNFFKSEFKQFKQDLIDKYYNQKTLDNKESFIHRAVMHINTGGTGIGGISTSDSKKLIQFLMEQGENINGKDTWRGYTPMHIAVKENNPVAIRILHELGADIYQKNAAGKTPVDLSVELGYKARRAQKALNRIMYTEKNSDLKIIASRQVHLKKRKKF